MLNSLLWYMRIVIIFYKLISKTSEYYHNQWNNHYKIIIFLKNGHKKGSEPLSTSSYISVECNDALKQYSHIF